MLSNNDYDSNEVLARRARVYLFFIEVGCFEDFIFFDKRDFILLALFLWITLVLAALSAAL